VVEVREGIEMTGKPKTMKQHQATWSTAQRAALSRLSRTVQATVPEAEPCLAYGVPAFRLGGRFLVGYSGAARHCAFYPGSAAIAACKRELRAYDTSKGTIRFQPEKPLPAPLVRKLVKIRVSEME
jgi:uncharacterized protein YdhG (YjbR/CyaY superfamily)